MENTKKAVVVRLGVRLELEEHELHPTYGQLYTEGYTHADRGTEALYLLSEPLPEGTTLDRVDEEEELDTLRELGYTLRKLQADKTLVEV